MRIERFGPEHLQAVAALHADVLGGLLSRLGLAVITEYYRAALLSDAAIGLVVLDGRRVCGFAFGAAHPQVMREQIVANNAFRLARAMLATAIRRPRLLASLARTFRNPGGGEFDPATPELVYVAVAPDCRGLGIGRELLRQFGEQIRSAGSDRYELSVEASNEQALVVYRAAGFVVVREYTEFDSRYLRLASPVLASDKGGSPAVDPVPQPVSATARLSLPARAGRYIIAGIVASITYFLSVLALVEWARMSPVAAAAVATGVVILTSYIVNRTWVFDTNRTHASAFLRFTAASVLGIAINTATMFVVVRLMGGPYVLGAVAAMVIVPPLNFVVNYLWTFGSSTQERRSHRQS